MVSHRCCASPSWSHALSAEVQSDACCSPSRPETDSASSHQRCFHPTAARQRNCTNSVKYINVHSPLCQCMITNYYLNKYCIMQCVFHLQQSLSSELFSTWIIQRLAALLQQWHQMLQLEDTCKSIYTSLTVYLAIIIIRRRTSVYLHRCVVSIWLGFKLITVHFCAQPH